MINELYFENFPELETKRLILRKIRLEDAPDLKAIRSDERVMIYMDTERHTKIEISEKWILDKFKMYQEKIAISWSIIEKLTGKFIGDFSFFKIDKKNSRAEIGYTLKPECWGKGFMKEAMFSALNFGFTDLNLHSLEANINPENIKSRAVLKKMGFKKEAYFRENYYYEGNYLDSEIYSLLKSDFIAYNKHRQNNCIIK